MKKNSNKQYALKILEAQWDELHDTSVKPFFEQLKRQTDNHDALYRYRIFYDSGGLRNYLNEYDKGIKGKRKIAYFACHGKSGAICAIEDISRTKLKNIVKELTSYEGMLFGACDFVDRETAEYLLGSSPHLKWVAGYSNWVPWLESTICDLLFFRLLFTGYFQREKKNAYWEADLRPEDAAEELYKYYLPSADLKFSLFYRTKAGIKSTLEGNEKEFNEFKERYSSILI